MSVPECPSTLEIPTTKTHTDTRIDRYLKGSSRRLVSYRSAMVILIVLCALTATACYQGMNMHPVDNGLLTALTFVAGIAAALAREIRRTASEAPK
jgi:hypothetical protein